MGAGEAHLAVGERREVFDRVGEDRLVGRDDRALDQLLLRFDPRLDKQPITGGRKGSAHKHRHKSNHDTWLPAPRKAHIQQLGGGGVSIKQKLLLSVLSADSTSHTSDCCHAVSREASGGARINITPYLHGRGVIREDSTYRVVSPLRRERPHRLL